MSNSNPTKSELQNSFRFLSPYIKDRFRPINIKFMLRITESKRYRNDIGTGIVNLLSNFFVILYFDALQEVIVPVRIF